MRVRSQPPPRSISAHSSIMSPVIPVTPQPQYGHAVVLYWCYNPVFCVCRSLASHVMRLDEMPRTQVRRLCRTRRPRILLSYVHRSDLQTLPNTSLFLTYASASIETWSDHDKEVPQPCVFPANFTERNRCTWMPNDGRDVLRPSDMRTADSPSGQLVATSHQPPRPTSHGGWDHLYRASSRHHKHRQGVIGRREHQAVGMTADLRTEIRRLIGRSFSRDGHGRRRAGGRDGRDPACHGATSAS